jgi:hypothetical protein
VPPPELLGPTSARGTARAGPPAPAGPPVATVAISGSAVGEVLAGVAGRPGGTRTRSSPCSAPGVPRYGRWPRWPTSSGRSGGRRGHLRANRNINYTNVCTFKCKFCAFSKGPLSLNLRGRPYLLELSEISDRVREAEALGATEVCLQGGIHPNFDGEYYLDVIKAVREASATIHIHGFTALEVTEGARRSDMPWPTTWSCCATPASRPCPGTAAEILDDPVRAVLCPDKINTEEWLFAHRTAHQVGSAPTSPSCSEPSSSPGRGHATWCGPGTSNMRPGGSPSSSPCPSCTWPRPSTCSKARRGPTFRETLLMHAVGRIAYRGHRQHPGQLGQDGGRRCAPDPPGRCQRPRRHPDGREHLPGGRGQPRSDDGRRRGSPAIVAPWVGGWSQRTTLYGRVDRSSPDPAEAARRAT